MSSSSSSIKPATESKASSSESSDVLADLKGAVPLTTILSDVKSNVAAFDVALFQSELRTTALGRYFSYRTTVGSTMDVLDHQINEVSHCFSIDRIVVY